MYSIKLDHMPVIVGAKWDAISRVSINVVMEVIAIDVVRSLSRNVI